MSSWTVNLDHAYFNFAELAWDESKVNRYPEDDPQGRGGQFAPADYKKGTAYQGSGSGGGGKKSDSGGGSKSGKPSGPARFKDSNGDGKDDRQLTPAQLKEALSGLSAEMRQALSIYPSVLGAIKLAIENGEDPKKHLERLPSRLRGAAEKAAKSIASGSGSSGDPKDPTGPIDVDEDTDEALVERLTAKGWAGNPSDSKERLYPPDHPKNPKNMSKRQWSVELDGASFDFSEVAWRSEHPLNIVVNTPADFSAVELAVDPDSAPTGKTLLQRLRADPNVEDPEALAAWLGRYKGARRGYSSIGAGKTDRELIAKDVAQNAEEREKRLKFRAEKYAGSARGKLAKLALDYPEQMKVLLKRENEKAEKAEKLANLKKQAKEPEIPDGAPKTTVPDITSGTDKQNSFAKDIRARLRETLQRDVVDEIKRQGGPEYSDLTVDKWLNSGAAGTAEIKKALQNDDPKFWIDKVRGNERSRAGLQDLLAKLRG